ncbi:anaphase-promoting complex subunit 2, partial [Phenoliferia sp. Uapishka_3]
MLLLIKNVETLKIRFGEASLQGCEVMIKDLQDSKRIDQHVHEQVPELPLHVTIVSRLFWPTFQNAPLKLPGQLASAQTTYDKSFARLKPDKKLRWLPQLGTVNLTIELKDRTATYDATPLQASVIELFGRQDVWEEDDLAAELMMTDSAAVRNALYFWNNAGVLKNVGGEEWKLLEEEDKSVEAAVSHVLEEEAEAVQSVDALQVEQMRVYWQFLKGILTNLGAQGIQRMHTTLGMLVPDYKGHTIEELQSLLEVMQVEGLVEKSGTEWKIVK